MVLAAAAALRPLQLTYPPNTETPQIQASLRCRLVRATSLSAIIDALPEPAFVVMVGLALLGCLVGSVLAMVRIGASGAETDGLIVMVSMGGAIVAYSIVSSVLGDGFMETAKHATAIGLGLAVQVSALVAFIIDQSTRGKGRSLDRA